MTVPTRTLPSGDELPVVGLGTWELAGETLDRALDAAVDAGYAHVDTAEGYRNEADLGDALARRDRDAIFLTSKVLPSNLAYESVIDACEASLDRLGVDHLDLYLIHWPNPAISLRETLDAMAHLHDRGLVRNVGVSNFTPYQLSCAQHVADVPIAVNQVELHPLFYRPDLVEYCQANDVVVQAAAPLARTEVFGEPVVRDIADGYGKTPAQIALRWAIEKDAVVLPRSSTPANVRENAALFDGGLDPEDHRRIDAIDREQPVYDTVGNDWDDDVWGISA